MSRSSQKSRGSRSNPAGQTSVTFQLHGNGWRFEPGHVAKLELVGDDSPYLQPNKEAFSIAVSNALRSGEQGWDTRQFGERRKPTTAEQAVPWLVGAVLALAGIVIVLLALIFSDANGGFASATQTPTPLLVPSASTPASPSAGASPTASPRPSASPTAVPTKPPTYGILEMFYLTRPSAVAFSELLRDDFATAAGPTVVQPTPVLTSPTTQ